MNEFTEGQWDYDGDDTAAAYEIGEGGYEVFTRDADGYVAEPIAHFLEEGDARAAVAAGNAIQTCAKAGYDGQACVEALPKILARLQAATHPKPDENPERELAHLRALLKRLQGGQSDE